VSSWSCPHELDGICKKVAGAYCRPGMKGCVLAGKVTFPDGELPAPVWPEEGATGPQPEPVPLRDRK
jgi:hypothetical protein